MATLKGRPEVKIKDTKYAVLSYTSERPRGWGTGNIGDDIQSLAAIHMLNKNGVHDHTFVEREDLKDYRGPPTRLIMNGWFMHDVNQFPPSQQITPLFIGFHCAKESLIERNVEYFKKHEPIGCRDTHTENIFKKNGIESYFSGCLTLGFDEAKEKGKETYVVDSSKFDTSEYENVKHISHKISRTSLHDRFKKANEKLIFYRKAKLVITSRLHCLLPCRAFGTKAIFVHKNYNSDPRFKGLEKYINGVKNLSKDAPQTVDRELIDGAKEDLNFNLRKLIYK